ncbi:uncharacterized protein LOC122873009 isoform X2 [Siniperca chuatsi]|uniref:uncharacterized protein LOC122873009 isoform X2 n=1 Tax=Siniperca chuatsi TaxID=119488 RepID=UPI001CE1985A|nr:uncharacterized protein LOC122873009 isoform X2 [Siniperca chuatsi]
MLYSSSEAMQLLCIAALLLSAVAARPDSWKPWKDEKFPPTGRPKLDADSKHGHNKQSMTQVPEDGDRGSGGDLPKSASGHQVWLPNRSSRPGNPQGPMKGPDGNDRQVGRPSQVSTRSKRQVPGVTPDEPGVRHPGPGRRNPGVMVSIFNVTFQNVTDVTLKEGEHIFLKHGEKGPHHNKGGKHGPPENRQYVKLTYNATEPKKVRIEYGVLKPMNLSKIVGEEKDPEE